VSDQPEKKTPILEDAGTATLPARAEPLVVRDRFERAPGVVFATIWSEFKVRFYGKTEAPEAEFQIRKDKLPSISPDGPIIAELGGESKVETTAAAAFSRLRIQGKGPLAWNGKHEIFSPVHTP
jgi:hypothetical protein